MSAPRKLAVLLSVLVVGAIVGGLFVIGSPGDARRAKLDARRVSDLRTIATGVDTYWNRRESLPADVAELKEILPHGVTITDPETNQPYTYRVIDDRVYELCAVFETECNTDDRRCARDWSRDVRIGNHGSGEQCFEIKPVPPD
jgi:hypothetical protein